MDSATIFALIGILIIAGVVAYYITRQNKKMKEEQKTPEAISQKEKITVNLQLQAYERLVIFCERIGLSNLVGRFNTQGATVRDLQAAMIDNIKTEYEYNVSQQIYVNPKMWQAVANLKEQNMFVINHIASTLPANAPASELKQRLIEFLKADEASLQPIVMEALSYEAKKLMI